MMLCSIQALQMPAATPAATNGVSGTTSRLKSSRPRRHHAAMTSAAGSTAVTVLVQQREHEQRQRGEGEPPVAGLVELHVGNGRQQTQHGRERVALLADPC